MSPAVTILGPCPCKGCGTIVRWLRLWDDTLLLLAADGALHECRWVDAA